MDKALVTYFSVENMSASDIGAEVSADFAEV